MKRTNTTFNDRFLSLIKVSRMHGEIADRAASPSCGSGISCATNMRFSDSGCLMT